MPWDQLCLYVYNLHCQVTPVRANGFCFLHTVEMVLYTDHDELVTFDSMESTMLGHLAANVNSYKMFHTGNVLKDAKQYFKLGTYCDNVLDSIVVATARALKVKVEPDNISERAKRKHTNSQAYYTCNRQRSLLTIYMLP